MGLNRYWTNNSDKKITAPKPSKDKRGGAKSPAATFKRVGMPIRKGK